MENEVMHRSKKKLMNVLKSVGRWMKNRTNSETFSEVLNALDNVKLFLVNHGFNLARSAQLEML